MSSRLHNKWHRHNHHTNPTPDPNFPDSSHDPIASPESPFQGTFVLNGQLSASQGGLFLGSPALQLNTTNIGLSTNGRIVVDGRANIGILTTGSIQIPTQESQFTSPLRHSGTYLPIIIQNRTFYIPLWIAE